MKFAELRDKTQDELETMLSNLKKESFNLRFQRVTGELANTARFREVRRTIAQIYTLFNDEGSKQGQAAKAPKAKAAKAEKKEAKAPKAEAKTEKKAEAKKPAAKKKAAKE
ncbi:MAG: 50S ribosomal protein L29 [Proteobacteria bacterium]|nr:50S ribosomal protein L29 [Pseudomonadota bacterium]